MLQMHDWLSNLDEYGHVSPFFGLNGQANEFGINLESSDVKYLISAEILIYITFTNNPSSPFLIL